MRSFLGLFNPPHLGVNSQALAPRARHRCRAPVPGAPTPFPRLQGAPSARVSSPQFWPVFCAQAFFYGQRRHCGLLVPSAVIDALVSGEGGLQHGLWQEMESGVFSFVVETYHELVLAGEGEWYI